LIKLQKAPLFTKRLPIARKSSQMNRPAHWYDRGDFEKLVYLQGMQHNIPIHEFERQFDGLTSTGKAKQITNEAPPQTNESWWR